MNIQDANATSVRRHGYLRWSDFSCKCFQASLLVPVVMANTLFVRTKGQLSLNRIIHFTKDRSWVYRCSRSPHALTKILRGFKGGSA